MLYAGQIRRIMDGMRAGFSFGKEPEITIEANPGTVDLGKLESCREAGINRISIGAQSMDDRELALLGRVHSSKDFLEAYGLARKAGFRNMNVDMMAALPGQKIGGYLEGLQRVIDLEPEHISAYSLIVEEGTPFYEWYGEDGKRRNDFPSHLPSEEEEREMYERTGKFWKPQDTIDMKYPIMQSRDTSAGIISVTGNAVIMQGSGWEPHLWRQM